MRRKGELSPAVIDRGWPHQVALPASASVGGGYKAIHKFCKDLTLRPRRHSVRTYRRRTAHRMYTLYRMASSGGQHPYGSATTWRP